MDPQLKKIYETAFRAPVSKEWEALRGIGITSISMDDIPFDMDVEKVAAGISFKMADVAPYVGILVIPEENHAATPPSRSLHVIFDAAVDMAIIFNAAQEVLTAHAKELGIRPSDIDVAITPKNASQITKEVSGLIESHNRFKF